MGSTPSTSRASWWPRRTARNKISLSMNLISLKKQPKMGLFLDSQENATCDKKILLKAGTTIYQQPTAWGRAKKTPRKNLVYQKCIRTRAEKATSRASKYANRPRENISVL